MKSEWSVVDAYQYNRSSALRWIIGHVLRYPYLPVVVILCGLGESGLMSFVPVLVGRAFAILTGPSPTERAILSIGLMVLGARVLQGVFGLIASVSVEVIAQRTERDARDELMRSLLGKSQTFHNRQQVGDIMARATNDVRQLNTMVNPGMSLIFSSMLSLVVPLVAIAFLKPVLLIAPLLFTVAFFFALRGYMRQLNPVVAASRGQFGVMNAGLAEAVGGIEVVKGYAQEPQEQQKFSTNARRFRDLFVQEGGIRARYLPLLLFGIMFGAAFAHALLLYRSHSIPVSTVIAYMGLLGVLRFPTFISIFTFSLVQMGIAGANRILELINTETELDKNAGGLVHRMQGQIRFENVSFGYGDNEILHLISFSAEPGETIAIVGQTGAGKSTLTKLVNRVYDATAGRVLVDGHDVRDWNLESLRGQISMIEQDVFLFSRSIAENIAFGAGSDVSRDQIEQAAREAQAHSFIMSFPEGYDTVIGERGVTLSGGQRQRLAIARAFLTNPRVLILDDSTSAIDSATEDEIQRAMRRVLQGRTTLLITHRLSQIRWADRILVLRRGQLVDQGSHAELITRSDAYRHIFARYEHEAEAAVGVGDAA